MQIIKPHDQYGWITAVIAGRWVQARVFDTPSTFGINNGRVSKLCIGKTDKHVQGLTKSFFDQMDFNYDRGHDFNDLPDGLLEQVLSELEALPNCPES